MKTTEQDFAQTYRTLSQQQVADLYSEIDTLTADARAALTAEVQKRGLHLDQLAKMHAAELRREGLFDRLQTQRRKKLAWYLITRNDPKGFLVGVLVVLVAILIAVLFDRRH